METNRNIYLCVFLLAAVVPVRSFLFKLPAISNAYQVYHAEFQKTNGVFLRTHYKHGCLDSGCCNFRFNQVSYSERCPMWSWYKWSFYGPMILAHKPFSTMCLECLNGRRNCVIGTNACSGTREQQWTLEFEGDSVNFNGDRLFTLRNRFVPGQCATIDTHNFSGLMLRNCVRPAVDEQLFYVDRDWFHAARATQRLISAGVIDFNSTSPYLL